MGGNKQSSKRGDNTLVFTLQGEVRNLLSN